MNDDEFESIKQLAAQQQALAKQSVELLAPEVEALIRSKANDAEDIEHLLDLLLDVAFLPEGLEQFKKLCRYYLPLNPIVTQGYVHAYRDMWDEIKVTSVIKNNE